LSQAEIFARSMSTEFARMAKRPAFRMRWKAAFAGLAFFIALLPVATPGVLALAATDGVWCESLAAKNQRPGAPANGAASGDCLVCLAASIAGSSLAPAAYSPLAPRLAVLATTPGARTRSPESLAAAHPPIRAPPIA
jgi:hypothetical protein